MIQITRSFFNQALFGIPSYVRNGQTTLSCVLMNNLLNMSTVDKPPLGAILVNPLKLPMLCEDNRIASDDVEMTEIQDIKVSSSAECTKQRSRPTDRNDNTAESDSMIQNVALDTLTENNDLSGQKDVVKNDLDLPFSDGKLRHQQLQSIQDGCKQTVLPKNLLDSVTDLVRQKRIKLPCSETQILQTVLLTEPEDHYREEALINVKEDFSNNCDDLANDQQACMGVITENSAECSYTDNKDAVKEFDSSENIGLQQLLHNIPEREGTSAECTGISTSNESLFETELLFPDLIEDFEKDDKTVQVYDISPLFTGMLTDITCSSQYPGFTYSQICLFDSSLIFITQFQVLTTLRKKRVENIVGKVEFAGELDKRYKSEKKKAFKRHRQNIKQTKKARLGATNKDGQEEEGEENVEKKQLPNYFIAMQIKNKEVYDALHKVQEEVLAGNQLLSSAMIKLTKLHLTLMVLRLETDDDIARSKCALETAIEKLKSTHLSKTLTVNLCGLGNFRNEIVFAKIKDKEQVDQLKEVAEVLEDSFMAQGLVSPDKHGFKPHITVMKLSKAKQLRKKGIKKINEKLYKKYKSTDFGAEKVTDIQLCSMMKTDSTGYYLVEHQVSFVADGNPKVDDSGYDESIVEPSDNKDMDKNHTDPYADMEYCKESSDDSETNVRFSGSSKNFDEKENREADNGSANTIDVDTLDEIKDKVQDDKTGLSDIVEDDGIINKQDSAHAGENAVLVNEDRKTKDPNK